ncbi:MAG TPA: hypothetical protein VJS30_00790 [Paraburkholderia sp.]|nr:hypothetical protein [Paraburkholderia sp.]
MKRLFAVLALLAGGLATEAVHPLSCPLAMPARREKIAPNGRRKAAGRATRATSATTSARRGV